MNNLQININEYLQKLKNADKDTTKPEYKNFRDELVKKTVNILREGRKGTEWEFKFISERAIAVLFNKKFKGNNYALYIFLTKCKNAKNFGAYFWKFIKE